MGVTMKKKFVDNTLEVFTVSEVIDMGGNLIVHYTKESTGVNYSCLLEAFSERFKPLEE